MIGRRPVLVGQAPGPRTDPRMPLLMGVSGERLRMAAGLSLAEYLAAFRRRNLLPAWPGRAPGGGDLFPMPEARAAADRLLAEFDAEDLIVAVGRRTGVALGASPNTPAGHILKARPGGESPWLAWVPHPSGLNRAWNSQRRRGDAGAFLAAVARAALLFASADEIRAQAREDLRAVRTGRGLTHSDARATLNLLEQP